MSEASFNPIRPVQPVDPVTSGTHRVDVAKPRAPAFEALLERLETQARELEQHSRAVSGPSDLADAVGRAQQTLQTALSFGDQVLEAFRQSRQQAAPAPEPSIGATSGAAAAAAKPASGSAPDVPSSGDASAR